MRACLILMLLVGLDNAYASEKVGATIPALPYSIGDSSSDHTVHLTAEMLIQISDQLIRDEIAEEEIDPKTFDLPPEKPQSRKKNALDEIEFSS